MGEMDIREACQKGVTIRAVLYVVECTKNITTRVHREFYERTCVVCIISD